MVPVSGAFLPLEALSPGCPTFLSLFWSFGTAVESGPAAATPKRPSAKQPLNESIRPFANGAANVIGAA
jgi:hypothetical protein